MPIFGPNLCKVLVHGRNFDQKKLELNCSIGGWEISEAHLFSWFVHNLTKPFSVKVLPFEILTGRVFRVGILTRSRDCLVDFIKVEKWIKNANFRPQSMQSSKNIPQNKCASTRVLSIASESKLFERMWTSINQRVVSVSVGLAFVS